MKKLALLSLIITGTYTANAQAAWSPALSCEGKRLVVDQASYAADGYQLVIRNSPEVLRYFSEQVNIDAAINDKGEFIVPVTQGGPRGPESLYVGAIAGGPLAVTVTELNDGNIRVALTQVGYRGTHNQELANWIFRDCSSF